MLFIVSLVAKWQSYLMRLALIGEFLSYSSHSLTAIRCNAIQKIVSYRPWSSRGFSAMRCSVSSALHFIRVSIAVHKIRCRTCAQESTDSFSEVGSFTVKVKVKCTLVQALRICTGRTVHRGSRGIALLFLGHGTRRGWGISLTPRSLFTPGKDPLPIVREAGWAPRPVWTCAENLAPIGIRSPDRQARRQSLYRLR